MKPRFRIRTRDGRDLEPRTLEILAELVRSGAVGPDDLVFDALTSEWAPARTHTVVRMFSDGGEPPTTPGGDEPVDAPTAHRAFGSFVVGSDPDEGDLALDLVSPEEPSPEEAAESFIARMEEEWRHDPDTPEFFREETRISKGSGAHHGFAEPGPDGGAPVSGSGRWGAPTRQTAPSRGRRRARLLARAGSGLAVVVGATWVASAVAEGPDAADRGRLTAAEAEAAEPRGPRSVPGSESRLRAIAYDRFVDAVDALRSDFAVEGVPSVWLEGRYLADAVAHPEVREFWARFLAYAEEAYASEVELYRRAYLDASVAAGVSGPVRSLRMAAATEDFETARRDREVHYERAWDLAQSALALHDQLVHLRGRISYEPARSQRVSMDPVIEAVGSDADAQSRLEAALDRVLRDLRSTGDADWRVKPDVAGWLAEGLRAKSPPTS